MTKRQKEMLKKRALLEFLNDYPEVSMEDILEYGLIKEIAIGLTREAINMAYYALVVRLANQTIIYAPKERFKVEEGNYVDKA